MNLILLIILTKLHGSSLFLPDSDTAALISLVSNTASTVTNTMQILEVAKETSEKMDKYNFMAMRRYFIARRIEQHAIDMKEAKKMKPRDLKELNYKLLNLKLNLKSLKSNIDILGKDIFNVDNFTASHWKKITNALKDEQESHDQAILSASSEANPSQNTAMNTALNGKILSKMRRDNLEYQKINLEMKKSDAITKVRDEQILKDWVGIGPLPNRGGL